MKKILILGANSYIGTSFHNYLTTKYPGQYQTDIVSLRGTDWKNRDWSGYDSVLNVTGKAHADISSLTEEQKKEYYAVNCDLAVEAARKAIADGVTQYIYFSSIIVYGDSSNSRKPVRITADTKPAPSNFYGDSKWQAEKKLQGLFVWEKSAGTRLAILRLPMIYGPGCKGNYKTLVKMAQKLPLFPTYHNERSVLQIDHLCEYLRTLAESAEGGLFWPQEDAYRSTPDMVFELAQASGRHIFHAGWLNPFVRMAFYLPGKPGKLARKAFGTLTIARNAGRKEKKEPLVSIITVSYNSEQTLAHTIESVLAQTYTNIEYWIIDGASRDRTVEIAESYRSRLEARGIRYHVLSEPDSGIYDAMNKGIRNATGVYFKVVDSDDWLDTDALQKVLTELRAHLNDAQPLDLMMANYVYEHVADNTRNIVDYKGILPEGRVFHWNEIGKFPPNKNILMHSVIYRTEVLRRSGMELPKHTFYVDNIFVYQPLPQVKTIYYMNLDLYRYFIGREDQSVNEANMIKRVDQQLRVTRIMMNAVDVYALPPEQDKLRAYMLNYFSMMMAISSIFLTLDGSKEALAKRRQLWDDLKAHDGHLYRRCRFSVAEGCNLPGWLGSKISIGGYRIAQKIFKFN